MALSEKQNKTKSFSCVFGALKRNATVNSLLVGSHSLDFRELFPIWVGNL